MKWWLVLVALLIGAVVTWFLTRREGESVPSGESPVSGSERSGQGEAGRSPSRDAGVGDAYEGEVDDASAFGGAPTEFSSQLGSAESWHRDAQDEDALLAREPASEVGDVEAHVPPVAEATPYGDVAGLGEPEAIRAVDAVEVDAEAAKQVEAPSRAPRESEQGTFVFDEGAADDGVGDKPAQGT
ncbi:hypothetical protein [Terrabacter terrigena]|uniref:Secreted protein n=1 Tax=Terrabacter terrigena TaxID=574718 RepID=A0ABW3N4E9_9MICO